VLQTGRSFEAGIPPQAVPQTEWVIVARAQAIEWATVARAWPIASATVARVGQIART
jgi:hypothetical protein